MYVRTDTASILELTGVKWLFLPLLMACVCNLVLCYTCVSGQATAPLEFGPGSLNGPDQTVISHMREQDGCKNQQL